MGEKTIDFKDLDIVAAKMCRAAIDNAIDILHEGGLLYNGTTGELLVGSFDSVPDGNFDVYSIVYGKPNEIWYPEEIDDWVSTNNHLDGVVKRRGLSIGGTAGHNGPGPELLGSMLGVVSEKDWGTTSIERMTALLEREGGHGARFLEDIESLGLTYSSGFMETLGTWFSDNYDTLYDRQGPVAGYDDAVDGFDRIVSAHPNLVGAFDRWRGDVISSDREAAALMFAINDAREGGEHPCGALRGIMETEGHPLTSIANDCRRSSESLASDLWKDDTDKSVGER